MSKLRLYDNTRISAFKRCPRYYYFRHVLDWDTTSKKVALVYGGAWHAAMEIVWPAMVAKKPKEEIAEMAFLAWVQYWTGEGLPYPMSYEDQQTYSPRTPGNAQEMLYEYIDTRYPEVASGSIELISCEKAFVVPLDPEDDTLFYVGKIDKVIRQRGRHRAIEHKTTTAYRKDGKFSPTFLDSFSPNSQVDGYLYALHMTYPDEVSGVWVDAALVHKTETAFKFIPIERQLRHLDGWLWDTRTWIDQIEAHTAQLEHCSASDPYMAAFPKNTNSCFDFNTSCAFIDLCKMWPNPIGKPVPGGYEVRRWDPLDHIDAMHLLPHKET